VFPIAILLAFLVLAALTRAGCCRSAVILIVPMCMLSALAGVKLFGATKPLLNRAGRADGGLQERDPDRGVRARARIPGKRHRRGGARSLPAAPAPIVMTSVAFIAGTVHWCCRTVPAPRCARRPVSPCSPA